MVTEAEARAIALALPGVEEGVGYRMPVCKLGQKFFTRIRGARESDAGALVLLIDHLGRDTLMASNPAVFFTTGHYRNHPSVLIRLDLIEREELEALLFESWRERAPKRMLAAFQAAQEVGP